MSLADGIDQLGTFEKDLLLRWFFHKLPMDQRGELMREFPLIYNKAVGRQVMIVINQAHENLPVRCPACQTGAEGESTYRHAVCDACKNAEKSWSCPTCEGPALASHDDGEQVFNLCESCNAWYTSADQKLSDAEVEKLRLNDDDE